MSSVSLNHSMQGPGVLAHPQVQGETSNSPFNGHLFLPVRLQLTSTGTPACLLVEASSVSFRFFQASQPWSPAAPSASVQPHCAPHTSIPLCFSHRLSFSHSSNYIPLPSTQLDYTRPTKPASSPHLLLRAFSGYCSPHYVF